MSPLVDAGVQPDFRTQTEIRDYLPDSYKTRQIPDIANGWYQAPGGDDAPELYPEERPKDSPASDPEVVGRHL